ncbi:MAG: hypothetical protein ACR2F2_12760 [Pyrinomonadaceae bacterium]
MKRAFSILFLQIILVFAVSAQTESLNNQTIILMTQAGLGKDLIIKKINDTSGKYRVSAQDLIDLKKAGVADDVIKLMMEKTEISAQNSDKTYTFSDNSQNILEPPSIERIVLSPQEALKNAKTVAIKKSSLYPSRQSLEKALFKRKDWQKYKFNIVRLKEDADLYIEIGHVPLSVLTRRYVFRIYDRQSGTILTAGETTSWGDLSNNLAREITQKLDSISTN